MLLLVVFTLLFNLTYTSTQQNSKILSEPKLAGFGIEPQQVENIHTNANISTNEVDGKQNKGVPAPPGLLKVAGHSIAESDVKDYDVLKTQEVKDGPAPPIVINLKGNPLADKQVKLNSVQGPHNQISNPDKKVSDDSHKAPSEGSDIIKENKSNVTSEIKKTPPKLNGDALQSGALLRGFYVFVGLSAIIMVYFLFRSYRLRHGNQPSTTVRKYGVTARRSDLEMRPLELEDDDDDTLFEIGSQRDIR